MRLMFIDYSSDFKTTVPTRLAGKLIELGLNTPLSAWILDFLTARPQVETKAAEDSVEGIFLFKEALRGCMGEGISHNIIFALIMLDVQVVRLQEQSPLHEPLIWVLQRVQEREWVMVSQDYNLHS